MWRQQHQADLAAPISGFQKALFSNGHEVAMQARQRFADGVLIERDQRWTEALEATVQALRDPLCTVIYQAAFERSGVRIRAEILERIEGESWHIIEVKSTVRARSNHFDDLALQCWVIEASDEITLDYMSVMTLNRDYVYDGHHLDVHQLFRLHEATETIEEKIADISSLTATLSKIIESEQSPTVAPGSHCTKPRPCEFQEHCHAPVAPSAYPLSLVPNLDKRIRQSLTDKGIHDAREIPSSTKLSKLQKRVVQSLQDNSPVASDKLKSVLDSVTFPVHHIDFESYMTAIPRFTKTKPYASIAFQWSNHIEHEDGRLEHVDFIFDAQGDPRRAFAETLLEAVGDTGTLCIYSSYEEVEIKQLANLYEDLKPDLLALLKRTWDLFEVVRNHFYHPDFEGSFSIKRVLPALCPQHDYSELEISDGKDAMQAYLHSLDLEPEERRSVHEQLKEYCALDTLAMLEIRRALAEFCA